jgi:hypothetical protein
MGTAAGLRAYVRRLPRSGARVQVRALLGLPHI